jgi:predicted metalloprotease with PDZ domain
MNIVKNNETSVPFSLGGSVYMSEDKLKEREKLIVKVIENAKKITGLEPSSRAPYWSINVVNSIKGGMAGTNSLVTEDSNVLIAHEIFHWWNGGTIYNGGALIAYYLDKDLNGQNKSLDEMWTKLYVLKKTISPEDFFKVLSEIGGEELSTKYRNMVNGKISF